MSIEEKILNDNSCSPYVDKGRGYVEIAFKDGAYWGYEEGCKTMIDKACECLIKLHNWPTQYEEYARLQEEFIKEFRKAMEE